MTPGLYVTGTDTGVGKTVAACALLGALRGHGLRAIGMKPVASGCRITAAGLRNDDAEALIAASDPAPLYDDCNPVALVEAIAPHVAAQRLGREIPLAPLVDAYGRLAGSGDRVVVEGFGGWMAPLSARLMQSDLAQAIDAAVILVVGVRLGCISHALLSARAIAADGCRLAGWIANRIDPQMACAQASIDTLRARIGAPLLGTIEFEGAASIDVAGL